MSKPLSKTEMAYYATMCASFNFRKASRAVTQLFDTALHPLGLRSTQLVILLASGIYESPSLSQLAEIIISDRTTLTRALKPLLRKGLLESVKTKDGRKRGVRLTSKGHHWIKKSVPYWKKAQNQFLGVYGKKEWLKFIEKLGKVVESVRKSGKTNA